MDKEIINKLENLFEKNKYKSANNFPLIENTYSSEEIINMIDVLLSDKLTMGPRVEKFENEFAKYVGAKYAVMVNSGSSANLLAMAVASNFDRNYFLKKGDLVAVPSICWSTSVWPIIQMGLEPVIIDVDPNTLNMDIEDLKNKITPKMKGIVAVHILGNSTNMDELMKIVKDNNLFLMEDTCESLGSTYNGKYLGTFGEFGTYSFYYSHHITTIEGGMVVCNSKEDYELLKCLRSHGWTRTFSNREELEGNYPDLDNRFLFVNLGYNLRPMETQGAMGSIQLKKLSEKNENRKYNFKKIKKLLEESELFSLPQEADKCDPAWFSLPILLNKNDVDIKKFLAYLTKNGVENRPIVTGNFARQPVFKKLNLNFNPEDFKGAEYIHKKGFFIGLPCEKMNDDKIHSLIDILKSYFV